MQILSVFTVKLSTGNFVKLEETINFVKLPIDNFLDNR